MESKRCCGCKRELPLTDFYKNKSYKDGLQQYCKPCNTARNERYYRENKDKVNAYRIGWSKSDRKSNPGKYLPKDRARTLKKFGESPEWYDNKMKEQGGGCALCGTTTSHNHQSGTVASLAIDHDHDTGKARGLLCMVCNHALHKLDKDRAWATRAVAYLERYK